MANVECRKFLFNSSLHRPPTIEMQPTRERPDRTGKDDRKSFEKPIAIHPALSCGAAFFSRPQFIRGLRELRIENVEW